jgi:hypothetical protein
VVPFLQAPACLGACKHEQRQQQQQEGAGARLTKHEPPHAALPAAHNAKESVAGRPEQDVNRAPAAQNDVHIDTLLWDHHFGGLCHVAAAVKQASCCCCASAASLPFSAKATLVRCCLERTACFVHLSAEAEVALSAPAPMPRGKKPRRLLKPSLVYSCMIPMRTTM